MQKEMENNGVPVKKGLWTEEEDVLLRNFIEKHGEGKWHKVPLTAGLNRCKKSCRLRWMNYLRPNIKRGFFTKDEVDLIGRLHKLLGNRWSLIAGRLPGRTANDVKNFWNTHIVKKSAAARKTMTKSSKVIKPRPRTFAITKLQQPACQIADEDLKNKEPSAAASSLEFDENLDNKQKEPSSEEYIQWWSSLTEATGNLENSCSPADNHHRLSSLSMDDVLELLNLHP